MKMRYSLSVTAGLMLLAACGRNEGQGGLTTEEERQLDEAARMLDENMIDVSMEELVANQAELEAAATPPKNEVEGGR